MATKIEILSVLKILGDVYPSFKLTSNAIEIYVRMLADIPATLLEISAMDHISRSTFFPSVAELRSTVFNLTDAIDPTPNAYEAWSEVQAEIRRVGHFGKPQFTNPIAAQVVGQLGWSSLCLSENQVSDRTHFIQAYQAIATQERLSAHHLPEVNEFITGLKSGSHPELESGEQA